MIMHPLDKLIKALSGLPGIGERTASRLAYHITKWEKSEALRLADAISDVKQRIVFCSECCNLTETELCATCSDTSRDRDLICVVEEPQDALAIERTGSFKGTYHVLHGRIAPLDGIGPEQIRLKELFRRIQKRPSLKEVIVATNPTTEGEATALYISKILKPTGIKLTRIAFGIPFGGDIEYADRSTLARSMEFRSAL
jgi:recombination protein RecR